ncbi:hypothetical protein LCGC14_3015000, partial [marine sediment metagenome]
KLNKNHKKVKQMYDPIEIEKKWQDKWKQAKIFEANPDLNKIKKFITSPYPYLLDLLILVMEGVS